MKGVDHKWMGRGLLDNSPLWGRASLRAQIQQEPPQRHSLELPPPKRGGGGMGRSAPGLEPYLDSMSSHPRCSEGIDQGRCPVGKGFRLGSENSGILSYRQEGGSGKRMFPREGTTEQKPADEDSGGCLATRLAGGGFHQEQDKWLQSG